MNHRKASLYFFLFLFLVTGCKPGKEEVSSSIKEKWYQNIPQNTGYVFLINKPVKISKLSSTVFDYYVSNSYKNFLNKLDFQFPFYTYIIQKDNKIKSIVSSGITKNFNSVFNEIESNYEGIKIYKTKIDKKNFYGIKLGESIHVSDSRINLENIIRKKNEKIDSSEEEQFIKTDRLLDHNADYNLVQITTELKPDIFNSSVFTFKINELSDIEAYDVIDHTKQIYTGIILKEENKFPDIFKSIQAQDNSIYQYIPEGFTKLSTLSFDDFTGFYSRFSDYFHYQALIKHTTITQFQTLYSINFFEENFNKGIILQLEDATDFLKSNPFSGAYNGYDIYEVNKPELISELFQPVLPKFNAKFFTIIDNNILITENKAYLKQLINTIENRNTLINRTDFKEFTHFFPSGSQLTNLSQVKWNNKKYFIYKNYKVDDENIYSNLLIQKLSSKTKQNAIEHLLTVTMKDAPIIKPQLIYNHKHKTYRIIFQNQDNELVYMDLSGKQLWKKKLDNKIIGKIYPVDLYRNGKIQYTFVTKNKWYIIDRYGRNVEKFPMKFRNEITQSVSVFDYDKNRIYRFGIIRGKKLELYNKDAKKLKGFEYKNKEQIVFPAVHYRIGTKDYILVQKANGQLDILDRRGNIRIPVEEKFDNLTSSWKLYNKRFININSNNELITIDTKGKVKKVQLKSNKPIQFDAQKDLFAAVTDHRLLINNKTFDIELGNYFAPYIYKKKNGKTRVFLSREDNNKIYAFDSKGQAVSFFPITGQQILDIKTLGNKNYLLSYDSERNLMIYRFK